MVMTMKIIALLDMMKYSLVCGYQYFREMFFLCLQGIRSVANYLPDYIVSHPG
jgi:hypothetical protein